MVLNKAARELLLKAQCWRVVSHDWWTYILVTGAGGVVFYDSEPKILYRQHSHNQVGSNASLFAKIVRMKMLLQGRFRFWNDINVQALEGVSCLLTHQNKMLSFQFAQRNKLGCYERVRFLLANGIYRQTLLGQIGLYIAAWLNKL